MVCSGRLFKKSVALLMTCSFLSLSLAPTLAEAKRAGSGRSFGKQSSSITPRQSTPQSPTGTPQKAPVQQAAPTTPPPQQAPAQPARNRWMGPLAGLAAGLGIAALMSHFGLGEGMAGAFGNILMIALLAFVGIWLFRKLFSGFGQRQQPQLATAGASSGGNSAFNTFESAPSQYGSVGQLNTPNQYRMGAENNNAFGNAQSSVLSVSGTPIQSLPLQLPAGFDTNGFLNASKQVFVKVQAAFDASDVNSLREFASDEVLAELQRQIQERGAQLNKTEVVTINAELVGFETDVDEHLASVHFSGMLREQEGAAAEPFEEVWNLSRPVNGRGGWVLAGMQSL